jgi:hypothetical protein
MRLRGRCFSQWILRARGSHALRQCLGPRGRDLCVAPTAVAREVHTAPRRVFQSCRKTTTEFQLRIVGVTKRSRDSDFGRSPLVRCGKYVSRACTLALAPVQVRDTFGVCSCDAEWLAAVARRGFRERARAGTSGSIWRSRAGGTASEASGYVSLTPSAETSTIVRSTGF